VEVSYSASLSGGAIASDFLHSIRLGTKNAREELFARKIGSGQPLDGVIYEDDSSTEINVQKKNSLALHIPLAERKLRNKGSHFDARDCLVLPAPTAIEWPLKIPQDPVLTFALGGTELKKGEPFETTFRISFRPENDDDSSTIFEGQLKLPTTIWQEYQIGLDAFEGLRGWLKIETLENDHVRDFEAIYAEKTLAHAVPLVANPKVVSSQPKRTIHEAHSEKTTTHDKKINPNVILISIDTLRYDRLSRFGRDRRPMPSLDHFSQRSVTFDNSLSNSPWTFPSHTTMLTGLHARNHHAINATNRAQKSLKLLSEILYENGYTTAGFVRHSWVSNFGLDQGFEQYAARELLEHDYRTVNDAIDWVRRAPHEPFFLFVHLFGSHGPFEAPVPYNGIYTSDYSGSVDGAKTDIMLRDYDVTHEIARYDEGVRYVDDQLGRLLRSVEARDLLENTVVVITSDHGEAFSELPHGGVQPRRIGHTRVMFDEVLRIPMVLYLPPTIASGVDSSEKIEHIDLMPSILELIGISGPTDIDGRSWARIIRDKEDIAPLSRRHYFADTEYKKNKPDPRGEYLIAWRVNNLKYMAGFSDYNAENLQTEELYDIEKDPHESVDLCLENGALCEQLRKQVLEFIREQRSSETVGDGSTPTLDESQRDLLEALGYL
jgi:arylsulfatase